MTGIHRGAVLHVLGTHGPRGRLLPVLSVVPTVPPAPRGPFPAQSPALPCPALHPLFQKPPPQAPIVLRTLPPGITLPS